MATQSAEQSEFLSLANLFRDCVECFGLIHPSKSWDHSQRILLTKLGIQQARLLIWGDILGVFEPNGEARDPRLDDGANRKQIDAVLRSILDRPANVDRVTQFAKYGLRPPKRDLVHPEPALDYSRMGAFRERYQRLGRQRLPSVTANHWQLVDVVKFKAFVLQIKEGIDTLIQLMGTQTRVDQAMNHDIKAFGWHPVFDKIRASNDGLRLRSIKEACADEYPDYAAATTVALAYLDKEWKDSYQEALETMQPSDSQASEIPYAAAGLSLKNADETKKPKRLSIFGQFSMRSWGRSRPEARRTKSIAEPERLPKADDESIKLVPARSKSVSAIPIRRDFSSSGDKEQEKPDSALAEVEASKSSTQDTLDPVKSMVSRHDRNEAYV
jgi:hypothetical protein